MTDLAIHSCDSKNGLHWEYVLGMAMFAASLSTIIESTTEGAASVVKAAEAASIWWMGTRQTLSYPIYIPNEGHSLNHTSELPNPSVADANRQLIDVNRRKGPIQNDMKGLH